MPDSADVSRDKIVELIDEENVNDEKEEEIDENDFDEWEPTNLSISKSHQDKIKPESDKYDRYETPENNKLSKTLLNQKEDQEQDV